MDGELPATQNATDDVPVHNCYIGGRYLKFSRKLSQTPWTVDKQLAKTMSSIEELVVTPFQSKFLPRKGITFMSAGREDVDVRCLGTGRPFALSIHETTVPSTSVDLSSIALEVNQNHGSDVRITDVRFVTKEELRIIKEGEETKTKTYRALCWSSKPVTQHELEKLCRTEPLTISQTTPVRVLHRRTFSVRPKTILWMKAFFSPAASEAGLDTEQHSGSSNEFYLDMCTQAGTYIKEFINGDFGRTTPSVVSILNIPEADCEALDVLDVDLAWPP